MSIIKKTWILVFGMVAVLTLNFGYGIDNLSNPSIRDRPEQSSDPTIGPTSVDQVDDGSKMFSDKLKGILSLPKPGDYSTSLGYIISIIQIATNWLLGLLATVALVYMIYCGFLVLTSGADDKNASKGKKGISTAAIALAGISLSWLIISAIIWFITFISSSNN